MALSVDLRARIVSAREEDLTYEQIAARLSVGRASVSRILRQHRETGSIMPRTSRCGRRPNLDEQGHLKLQRLIEEQPDATLVELADAIRERTQVSVSPAGVFRACKRLSFTRKKRPFGPKNSSAQRLPLNERPSSIGLRPLTVTD